MKVKSKEDLKDRELLVIKTAEGCGENKDKYACIIQLRQDGELGKKDPQKNPNLYTKSYTNKSGNKQYTNTVYLSEAEYKAIEKASEGNGYKTQKSACLAIKCDLKIEEADMKNASGQPVLNDEGKPVTKKKLALDFDTVRPSDYVFDTKSKTVHDINWETAAKPKNVAMYDHLKSMLSSYELTPNPYAEKQSEAVSKEETAETEKKQPLQSKREMTDEEYNALDLSNKGTLLAKMYRDIKSGDQYWYDYSELYQLGDRYFHESYEGYYGNSSCYEYASDEAAKILKEYEEESKRRDDYTVTEAGRQILDGKNTQAEKQNDTVTVESSKSAKTEFGVPDCWNEPTPTEAREAKRQANLEEKVLNNNGFDVKDLKGRDVIIIKAAEGCGKDKDGYLVSVTLRQDGEFGANDPHIYPCVSMHDYNGRRGNTVYLTKSQYEAVENAAGDNAFQPRGNCAMHMAVKCDLKERTDETGYKYLTLDTKTVQPPSVEFNEKTLTDHRDTISRNRKDVEEIQSLTKDADKIKSTLNARFASAAQMGSNVSQPESSTPDYPPF